MNTKNGIYALIKIGEKIHMEDFINNGAIFLRRLKAYRNIEDQARADIYEGASEVVQPENIIFTINGTRIQDFAGPVSIEGIGNPLVYCMYSLNPKHLSCEKGKYIDERCYEFGNTAVLITDVMAFYERLKSATVKSHFKLKCDLVEYVSWHGHSGEMGYFRKFDDLSYQHEWRAAFVSDSVEETFRLELGSLRDIAKIGNVNELNHVIEFAP